MQQSDRKKFSDIDSWLITLAIVVAYVVGVIAGSLICPC